MRWNQDHKLVVSDSAQSSDICVKCHKEDYCCVSPQVAELLLAVQDYQQRYSLFVHKQSLLRRVVNLSLGDSVTVQTKDNTELKVVVKYRGPLTDVDGLYFGVQLQVQFVVRMYSVFCANIHVFVVLFVVNILHSYKIKCFLL